MWGLESDREVEEGNQFTVGGFLPVFRGSRVDVSGDRDTLRTSISCGGRGESTGFDLPGSFRTGSSRLTTDTPSTDFLEAPSEAQNRQDV